MSFFLPATVEHEGRTLEVAPGELEPVVSGANVWNGEGDPSAWLAVAVFVAVREKFPGVPDETLIGLAAGAMGITAEHLRRSIKFQEDYMRWHDGDPDYRIL